MAGSESRTQRATRDMRLLLDAVERREVEERKATARAENGIPNGLDPWVRIIELEERNADLYQQLMYWRRSYESIVRGLQRDVPDAAYEWLDQLTRERSIDR